MKRTARRDQGVHFTNKPLPGVAVSGLSGLGVVIRLKADLVRKLATTQPSTWPDHVMRFVAALDASDLRDTTALLVLLTELREELRLVLGADQGGGRPAPNPPLDLRSGLRRQDMLVRFRQHVLEVILPLARSRRSRSPIAVETKRIIDERYAEPLTLDVLADAVGRSKRHLASVFLREFKVTVHGYLTQVRLNRALALIREGEKIEAVSMSVGYRSKRNFYRNFHTHIGVTPSAYRTTLSSIQGPPAT